jgi:argininosuccinate lyase
MPGYTHLQRAQVSYTCQNFFFICASNHFQPIRWSQWLLSYGVAFSNDLERLREVIKRVNKSPLGCGALAGNAFSIDRVAMAKELGFQGLIYNSMAAVADRDFVLETMQWGSTVMLHVSRWSEDLIIYSSTEFGFVRLAEAYTTGSSLMPQKRNCAIPISFLTFPLGPSII